jgi:L-alanine-DL-glutamate epimerase-like enolase superfamily enzyme
VQILQPDICRTGFSDGWRQRALALKAGVEVTAHMGSGSPVVQAAALQFGAAGAGRRPAESQFDLGGVLPEVFASEWIYRDGKMSVPETAGLGVQVKERELVKHCARVERWKE